MPRGTAFIDLIFCRACRFAGKELNRIFGVDAEDGEIVKIVSTAWRSAHSSMHYSLKMALERFIGNVTTKVD